MIDTAEIISFALVASRINTIEQYVQQSQPTGGNAGRATPGPIMIAEAKAGMRIHRALLSGGSFPFKDARYALEIVVSIDGQVQQTTTEDLSMWVVVVFFQSPITPLLNL